MKHILQYDRHDILDLVMNDARTKSNGCEAVFGEARVDNSSYVDIIVKPSQQAEVATSEEDEESLAADNSTLSVNLSLVLSLLREERILVPGHPHRVDVEWRFDKYEKEALTVTAYYGDSDEGNWKFGSALSETLYKAFNGVFTMPPKNGTITLHALYNANGFFTTKMPLERK